MATINYKGMKLEEITEPQIFDPPRKCVVWDDKLSPDEEYVLAITAEKMNPVVTYLHVFRQHCALLPSLPKPRMATWLEVAKWCATGNGLVYDNNRDRIDTGIMFKSSNESEPIMDEIKVRKWSDAEWHEPTVDYMELEETKL